ncbi:serine/threonine protein kinase [Desulfohalovibrio reitneri]|uniref:serine/threonine protein kinase n=1 Tax=Desulfohalovibrio reitneri TaxID=1307759 RepID=UPI0004A6C8BE|nr:serine/threonine protein kinase [Desulfohalovibrio reitneri]
MSSEVSELIRAYCPSFSAKHAGRIVEDTSEFMSVDHGDVIRLGGRHYLVLRDECEQRFGIDDPKYWVKRCREMESGERRILKLVFHETFPIKLGDFEIRCYRSPEKEARILNLVRGDLRFMQGETIPDAKGNPVRVLDIVRGRRLDLRVEDIDADHETYFHEHFPGILNKFMGACEAISFLHSRWEKHGDIRRDHLLVEYETGAYRWIDFDYAFDFHENPWGLDIFGLGNILLFLAGKGEHTTQNLAEKGFSDEVLSSLEPDDFTLMFANRLANLGKLYPYIPRELNNVLLHFSIGTYVFYDHVEEMLDELRPCLRLLGGAG